MENSSTGTGGPNAGSNLTKVPWRVSPKALPSGKGVVRSFEEESKALDYCKSDTTYSMEELEGIDGTTRWCVIADSSGVH